MEYFFKSKNLSEAKANISARLEPIGDGKLQRIAEELILEFGKRRAIKKYPSYVKCSDEKPPFYLNDGDLLYSQAVTIHQNGDIQVTPLKYGGSSDSVIWHVKEQLAHGQLAPMGSIGLFYVECAGSGTRIWTVDVWVGRPQRIKHEDQKRIE